MSGTNFCLIISTTPTTGAGLLVRCRLLLRPFHLRPSHRRHRVNATIRRATKPAASTVKSAADPDIVWPRASSMTTSTMAARSARSSRSGAPARDGRRRLRPWIVTQPWTPRTRPPPCTELGKSKKNHSRLRAGKESDDTHATYRVAAFQTFLSGRI